MPTKFRLTEIGEELVPLEEHVHDYQCWDWSRKSQALIASDGEHSVVIEHIGGPLDYWISEVGVEELFDGVDAGLWVWEGTLASTCDYMGEYDEELVGDFRKLTPEEWEVVRDGDDLFLVDDGWFVCGEGVAPTPPKSITDIIDELKRLRVESDGAVLYVRALRYIWDNERRAFDYDMFARWCGKLFGSKSVAPWNPVEVAELDRQITEFDSPAGFWEGVFRAAAESKEG